ncbi:hypothetical protein NKDENANG_00669 [Candidatus Entotheonellaceae bacterium PAL068K]
MTIGDIVLLTECSAEAERAGQGCAHLIGVLIRALSDHERSISENRQGIDGLDALTGWQHQKRIDVQLG